MYGKSFGFDGIFGHKIYGVNYLPLILGNFFLDLINKWYLQQII
jgi:hypothetical protein